MVDSDSYNTEEEKRAGLSAVCIPVKKKKYLQKYNPHWKECHKWHAKSKKGCFHFCWKVCQNDYLGGATQIKRHESSKKHTTNCSSLTKQKTLFEVVQRKHDIGKRIKEGELRIVSFIVEHNFKLNIAGHLT